VGSKTLLEQNPPFLNCHYQLTDNGHKTKVVVVVR